MAWYKSGTVSVTSGSPTVTGSGTSWVANVKAGHGFIGPDRFTYEILSVDSNTQLTLAEPYASASDSGEAYKIVPTQGIVQTLATAAQTLISDFTAVRDGAGQGQFADGSVSSPGVRFAADLDTGFYRPGTNSIGWVTAGAECMRLNATGNLGIGTASPSGRLHLVSASNTFAIISAASTFSASLSLCGNASTPFADSFDLRQLSDGTAQLYNGTNSPMVFFTNDIERMRINADGQIVFRLLSSVPAFGSNTEMSFHAVSNTQVRLSYRGTDGTTRSVTLTLA